MTYKFVVIILIFSHFCSIAQTYKEFSTEAEKYYNNGNLTSAISSIKKAIKFAEIDLGKDNAIYKELIHDLSIYQYFQGEFTSSISNMKMACSIQSNLTKKITQDYINYYSELGNIYYSADFIDSSYMIANKVLQLQENLSGTNTIDYAIAANNIGLLNKTLGKISEAIKMLQISRYIFISNSLNHSIDFANLLNNIADVYFDKGRFIDAENYYLQAIKLLTNLKEEKSELSAIIYQNIGNLYVEMTRYEQAKKYLEQAYQLKNKLYGENNLQVASSLNDLGVMYNGIGEEIRSNRYYLKSLAIKEKILSPNHISYLKTLNNLVILHQFSPKNIYLKKLEDAIEQIYSQENINRDQGIIIFNLVKYYLENDISKLEKETKRFISVYNDVFLEDTILLAEVSSFYASLFSKIGHDDSTIYYLNVAKLLLERYKLQESVNYLDIIQNIAGVYFKLNKIEKAEENYTLMIQLAKKLYSKNSKILDGYLLDKVIFLEKTNRKEEAKELLISIIKKRNHQLVNNVIGNNSKELEKLFSSIKVYHTYLNSFLIRNQSFQTELLQLVYESRILLKSFSLSNSIKMKSIIQNTQDIQLKSDYYNWQANKEYLNKIYNNTSKEVQESISVIDSLQFATDQLEAGLTNNEALKKHLKYDMIDWKKIQKTLEDGEVVIEIIRVRDYFEEDIKTQIYKYIAIIFNNRTINTPDLVQLNNGDLMDNYWSSIYFDNIFNKKEDKISYNRYWKAIADKINGAKKAYVSLDGIYNILNINTFKNPITNKFLIEELDIQFVKNTRDIYAFKKDKSTFNFKDNNNTALIFGYPDYYTDLAKKHQSSGQQINAEENILEDFFASSHRSGNFEVTEDYVTNLPGTKIEAESIKEILDNNNWHSYLYLKEEATEEKLKTLHSPTVLHIATHGLAPSNSREDSVLEANHSNKFRGPDDLNSEFSSGLLMAGSANSYKYLSNDLSLLTNFEDGILTGYEASGIDLGNTKLVVLSACYTRVGATTLHNKEGFSGLIRAFMIAGAKSIIASSWGVDDEATLHLMKYFYKEWAVTDDIHIAFRNAQLKLLKENSFPKYWGPFILVEN